jgi:hypothetical protein
MTMMQNRTPATIAALKPDMNAGTGRPACEPWSPEKYENIAVNSAVPRAVPK